MRWLKRIGIVVGLLLLALLVTALIVARRSSAVPDWYARARNVVYTPRIEEKQLFPLSNWAGQTKDDPRHKTKATNEVSVVFTPDDINMLIVKWSQDARVKEKLEAHIKDIRVRFNEGKIVIAGESVEYGKIISLLLQPGTGPDGYATLKLDSIRVGEAPLPLVAMNGQKEQLNGAIGKVTAKQREKLSIDEHGVASPETIGLYYTTLITDLINGKSPDAYAFIMYDPQNDPSRAIPTRVRDLQVDDTRMKMTLEKLTPEQRTALLDHLRQASAPAAEPANAH